MNSRVSAGPQSGWHAGWTAGPRNLKEKAVWPLRSIYGGLADPCSEYFTDIWEAYYGLPGYLLTR